jgi:hypothetical protein
MVLVLSDLFPFTHPLLLLIITTSPSTGFDQLSQHVMLTIQHFHLLVFFLVFFVIITTLLSTLLLSRSLRPTPSVF